MTERELNAARDLAKRIKDIENDLTTFRMSMARLVPIRDGQPKGHSTESQVEKIAVLIVEKERELSELKNQLLDVAGTLAKEISTIPLSSKERRVIFLRYVACMHFRDIAFETNLSDARVYSLHAVALDKILTQ